MPDTARTIAIVMTLALSTAALAHDGNSHHPPIYGQSATDDSFGAQMGRAMEAMERDMAVTPSGDPDRDFAAMMIPHHQGAVDMARIQLQFGKDPVLRRLAQAIIVEQLQEIGVMKRQLMQLPSARDGAMPRPQSSDKQ